MSDAEGSALATDLRVALLGGNADELADVHLESAVDGERVPAVRALLAARSAVMRKMLFGAFAEGQRRVVTVSEMQGATIKAVIEYCYTDQVEMLCQPPASASDAAALVALAVAADFFGLPALVTLCCNAVKEAVSKAAAWACVGFDAISEVAYSVVSIRALANHCLEVIRHKAPSALLDEIDGRAGVT